MFAEIAKWLQESQSTVAFTGAGISTESGIPDFRSPGGVWATSQPVYFEDFLANADARQEYWRQKSVSHRDFAGAEPNLGHRILARWQQAGRLSTIITQNIDGLHQIAGSPSVLELHGTAREVVCLDCAERFPDVESLVNAFLETKVPPICPECGGMMKHATVSFGQSLPTDVLDAATDASQGADLFLAMGSSLVVQPAAILPDWAKKNVARLVIINRDATPLDDTADAVIHAAIGEALETIDKLMS